MDRSTILVAWYGSRARSRSWREMIHTAWRRQHGVLCQRGTSAGPRRSPDARIRWLVGAHLRASSRSRCVPRKPSFYTSRGLLWRDVLPEAEHTPSGGSQGIVRFAITLDIARELRLPVGLVCFRDLAVVWTAVPEASVDEHRQPPLREGNVDAHAAPVCSHGVVAAKPKPSTVQQGTQFDLRASVSSPVRLHRAPGSGARWVRVVVSGRTGRGNARHRSE